MTIIVYYSKTGLTKKYAALLAGILHCRSIPLDELGDQNLHGYDNLVFMTRLIAGRISKIGLFEKIAKKFPGRSILVVTGASPEDSPNIQSLWNTLPKGLQSVPHFYLQAGLNYEKMNFIESSMMNTLKAVLLIRPDAKDQLEKISTSFDTVNEKSLRPIIDLIKEKK